MKTSIFFQVATAGLIRGAPHHYYRAAPAVPGYGVDEMQWGFSRPFGEPIFVNGTAQEIRQSLEDARIMHHVSPDQVARSMAPGQEHAAAEDAISVKFCGVFPVANSHHVSAQIPAIVTISGPAVIGPGPGNCAPVSCAQNSAIWWCNDRNTTIMLPEGMQQLGDAVDAIIGQCCNTTHCRIQSEFPISGQAFSDEGWNVLVREEDC